MFLFSKERSGLLKHQFEMNEIPSLEWKLNLKQLPTRCVESSPVIDDFGNIYFGSHDGCFYCVDQDGNIKWQFVTESKVYSSPMISGDKLYFNCNMSNTVCLDLNGNLIWQYDSYVELKKKSKLMRLFLNLYSYLIYDYEFKKYMKINAWASPNLLKNESIVTVLYGVGVVALDKQTGKVIWKHALGNSINHLAGVAITEYDGNEFIAAVGQNSGLHFFDEPGKLLWKTKSKIRINSWANPSIDSENKCIYFSESYKNQYSKVYKYDFEGTLIWEKEFSFGCRASIAISLFDYVVFLGLNGLVHYLNKENGSVLYSNKIAASDRGLWTNPAILPNGNVLINTKKSQNKGSLICLSKTMETLWEIDYGKALSVPVLDRDGNLYTGTWDGDFFKYKSKN